MTQDALCLFALNASRPYGERVAAALGLTLAGHEEREFEDGEHKARPLENVRGRDVFVIHSLYGEPGMSANDKLVRLLFFIGALKDASAARVTASVLVSTIGHSISSSTRSKPACVRKRSWFASTRQPAPSRRAALTRLAPSSAPRRAQRPAVPRACNAFRVSAQVAR